MGKVGVVELGERFLLDCMETVLMGLQELSAHLHGTLS